ncbi:MAG: nucleoside-diphosphate kinase [Bacilli bacterium]|nr:nucleoside-diphosphate kinase [Bacilli bacterium]
MEKTFVMLKPDAVKRGLIGKIIMRIEDKGFKITSMQMMNPERSIFENHYAHLSDEFRDSVIDFMISGSVVAMIVEGDNVIEGIRKMMGKTKWQDAMPGTIRGDFTNTTTFNLIHGSDSKDNAEIEIKRFFTK